MSDPKVIRDRQGKIIEVVCHGRAQIISNAHKRVAVCRECKAMWRIETGVMVEINPYGGVR